jgi:hypothetical protein
MKNLKFWSDNPATIRAELYLRLRRRFPTVPAIRALDFVRMVQS